MVSSLLEQVVRAGDYIIDAGSMYGQTSLGLSKVLFFFHAAHKIERAQLATEQQAKHEIEVKYES
jgi:hypothetical protein